MRTLAPGTRLPLFWLAAGSADRQDVADAEYFWQELQLHQANVPLVLTPGGGHTMATWHAEVPPMLEWMTARLADGVAAAARRAAVARSAPSTGQHASIGHAPEFKAPPGR